MKRLLLMILTLGVFCSNVNGQTKRPTNKATSTKTATKQVSKDSRDYYVGDDGFEWYKVRINGKHGAEDRNGNTIIPAEYDGIIYDAGCYSCANYNPVVAGFIVRKGEFRGWYNKSGRCIIPYSRGYKNIWKYDSESYGTHYSYTKDGGGGICDRNGREIVSVKIDNLSHIEVGSTSEEKKRYYLFFHVNNLCGIADANGNIVVTPEFEYNGHQDELERLISTRVTTTNNPLSGNTQESLAEAEGRQSSSSNSISSNNTQNNSSQGQSSTIVVEHHRDPVPVQEWHACIACGGMGTMGCDGCGGSGSKYIGNNLRRCGLCNGTGIIPCRSCYGNKGQYITVYR